MANSSISTARFLPESMVVIYDSTLTADAASFDVQNIPQGYKHLLVTLSIRSSQAVTAAALVIRFNNDSSGNYHQQYIQVNNTTVAGSASASATQAECSLAPGSSAPASYFGGGEIMIPDYASSTSFKHFVANAGVFGANTAGTDWFQRRYHGLWKSTAGINRITIADLGSNLVTGSRLTIYGLGGAQLNEITGTDGWTSDPATWTYATATTFTVSGDKTAKFSKGTRIKLRQTTVKYFVVTASSHSTGTTTVTITGGSDYSLANATITDPFYSYQSNPQGYPGWFNYTPTLSALTTPPTLGSGAVQDGRFTISGSSLTLWEMIDFGTSGVNAGSGVYLLTTPVSISSEQTAFSFFGSAWLWDSSSSTGRIALVRKNSATDGRMWVDSATADVQHDAPWTWAASDQIRAFMTYEI